MRKFSILKNNKITKALGVHSKLILKISLIALPLIFFLFGFFGSQIEKNSYPQIVQAAPPGYPYACGQRRCAFSLGATEQYYCRDACGTQPNHCVTVGSCDSTTCLQDSDCSKNVACPGPDGTTVCARASCIINQCVYQCTNDPGAATSCEQSSCSNANAFRMAGCTPPGWMGIPERICGVTATNGNVRTVVGLAYGMDTLNYYIHEGSLGSGPTRCRFNTSLQPLRSQENPDLWNGRGCGTFYDEGGDFALGVPTKLCSGCSVTPNNTWESGNVKRGRYRVKIALKNLNATGSEGTCNYIVRCKANGNSDQAASIERVDRDDNFVGVGECEQPIGTRGVKGAYIDPASISVSNAICNLNGTGNGPFDGGGWGSIKFDYRVVDQGVGPNLRVDVGGWYFEPEYQFDKLQGIGSKEQRLCANSDVCWRGSSASCGSLFSSANGCSITSPNGSNFSYSLNTETYAFKTSPARQFWVGIDSDNRSGSCSKFGEYAITTTGAVPAGNFDIARCNDPPRADALKGWACEIGNPSYQIPVQICKDAPCNGGGSPIAVVVANRDRKTDPENDYIGGNSSVAIEDSIIASCGGISGKAGIGWVLDTGSFGSLRDGSPHMVYAHPLMSDGSLGAAFTYYYPGSLGGPLNPPSSTPVSEGPTGQSPPAYYSSPTPYRISCPFVPSTAIVRNFEDPFWDRDIPPNNPTSAPITLTLLSGGYTGNSPGAVTSHTFTPIAPGDYRATIAIPAGWFSTRSGSTVSDSITFSLAPGETKTLDFYLARIPAGTLSYLACPQNSPTTCQPQFMYTYSNIPYAAELFRTPAGTVFFPTAPYPNPAWGHHTVFFGIDIFSDLDSVTYGSPYTYQVRVPWTYPFYADVILDSYALNISSPCPTTIGGLSVSYLGGATCTLVPTTATLRWTADPRATGGYDIYVNDTAAGATALPPGGTVACPGGPAGYDFCVRWPLNQINIQITPGHSYAWAVAPVGPPPGLCAAVPATTSPIPATLPVCTYKVSGRVFRDVTGTICASGATGADGEQVMINQLPPGLGPYGSVTGSPQTTSTILGLNGSYEYEGPLPLRVNRLKGGSNYNYQVNYNRIILPPEYKVVGSRTNSSGAFTGPAVAPLNNIVADQTVDFCVSNIAPWFQVHSADVRMRRVKDRIPLTKFGALGASPAIFISSLNSPAADIGPGPVSSLGWKVNNEYNFNFDKKSLPGKLSYSYFKNSVLKKKDLSTDIFSCLGNICTMNGLGGLTNKIQLVGSSASVCDTSTTYVFRRPGGGASRINVPPNKRLTFLVNGSVRIEDEIEVPQGSLYIIAACGDITVANTIGGPSNIPATAANSHLQGIFTAERDIIIGSTDNGCSTGTADIKLNVAGSLIAYARHPFADSGGGAFQNNRSLCSVGDKDFPVVEVIERFDFLSAMPEEYKTKSTKWREVNP